MICKISSYAKGCLFIFLILSFEEQNNFYEVWFFCVLFLYFGVLCKKLLPNPRSGRFLSPSGSFIVLSVWSVSSPFLYVVWGGGIISLFFLWLSSCPRTTCWQDCFSPYWIVLTSVSKSSSPQCKSSSLDPPLLHWSVSAIMPMSPVFKHYSFLVNFEIRKCESSNFLLFQDYFGYLDLFNFHMNFRIFLSFSEK